VHLDSTAAERLEALSTLVGDPDLAVAVMDLARSALAAIPSCLAMQVTIRGAEPPVTVTTPDFLAGTVPCSSLRLEIRAGTEDGRYHRILFLAEFPDAFRDFDDVPRWTSGIGNPVSGHRIARLVVNGDLSVAEEIAGQAAEGADALLGSVDGQRLVERAVGALLNSGFTVEGARSHLEARAKAAAWTLVEEAQEVLASAHRR
jgi:hypothetical protein